MSDTYGTHMLDDLDNIRRVDSQNMLDIVLRFPEHIEDAVNLAEIFSLTPFRPDNIIVAGMGGSAIGGEILSDFLFESLKIPIIVNKRGELPAFADKKTLLFVVSYSGNTEETLNQFSKGLKTGCRIIAITSGGKVEEICKSTKTPMIKIPPNFQPRVAIAYLFFPMLIVLKKLELYNPKGEITDAIEAVKSLRDKIKPDVKSENNVAKALAQKLYKKIPVIYSGVNYKAIANRWHTQFNENAKILAWCGFLPEIDHNEIVGWCDCYCQDQYMVLHLRDPLESKELQKRTDVTIRDIFEVSACGSHQIVAEGETKLGRMMYLLHLGDVTSIYLAILRGTDPTPVQAIDRLKRALSE